MKKYIITSLVVLLSSFSQSQWQSDVRLTVDIAYSITAYLNNSWCVKSSGDTVHVVWSDNRNGQMNLEIYYKRSVDGGLTWSNDTRLTNSTGASECQSVLVSGSNVHVIWGDFRDGNGEIYYKRSSNGGLNWENDVRLTNDGNASLHPSAAVSGSDIVVVWDDTRAGNYEIYFKRSTDNGTTWEADTRLTNNTAISDIPCISMVGSLVMVVWRDNRDGNSNEKVYYKRSTDKGLTWGSDSRISSDTMTQYYPSIAIAGNNVHVVWEDYRVSGGGNGEIFYKRSTDGGINWGTDIRLTSEFGESLRPTLSLSGSLTSPNVHVVWTDERNSNKEIYYKCSSDNGSLWEGDTRLTSNSADSYYPFVSASGPAVHVIWQDNRDGNLEIYYKRNPTGNVTGLENIVSEIPKEFRLEQNYPNPFNPVTTIRYTIPIPPSSSPLAKGRNEVGFVSLKVYDVLGNEIATLVNEEKPAGSYEVNFNAAGLSSGMYFYKLQALDPETSSGQGFVETKKMLLLK